MLDEGLGLELSSFGRLKKTWPGMSYEHELVPRLANNLWFRQTDYVRDERRSLVRRNATSKEGNLRAIALRTKPHTNPWLYLSPRLCTLGQDAFDDAPAVVKEIHQYKKKIPELREEAGATMLQVIQEINTMSLDWFQADGLATRAEYESSDAIFAEMGAGWSPRSSAVVIRELRDT